MLAAALLALLVALAAWHGFAAAAALFVGLAAALLVGAGIALELLQHEVSQVTK